ncbi:MAG TPA: hypothetical protein VME17_13065 [Bryobacteraceae bacterium]|nr:hypothetical protein [Bryobacteraceae bacterium]
MSNVQIAITNSDYAEALRDLLTADGQHQVHLVDYPSPAIDGVVVIDENILSRMTSWVGFDFDRSVVFTRKVAVGVNRLWDAGVRHMIHADQPPQVGRLVVLGAERRLGGSAAIEPELSMFDETDRLFLRSLRIID